LDAFGDGVQSNPHERHPVCFASLNNPTGDVATENAQIRGNHRWIRGNFAYRHFLP